MLRQRRQAIEQLVGIAAEIAAGCWRSTPPADLAKTSWIASSPPVRETLSRPSMPISAPRCAYGLSLRELVRRAGKASGVPSRVPRSRARPEVTLDMRVPASPGSVGRVETACAAFARCSRPKAWPPSGEPAARAGGASQAAPLAVRTPYSHLASRPALGSRLSTMLVLEQALGEPERSSGSGGVPVRSCRASPRRARDALADRLMTMRRRRRSPLSRRYLSSLRVGGEPLASPGAGLSAVFGRAARRLLRGPRLACQSRQTSPRSPGGPLCGIGHGAWAGGSSTSRADPSSPTVARSRLGILARFDRVGGRRSRSGEPGDAVAHGPITSDCRRSSGLARALFIAIDARPILGQERESASLITPRVSAISASASPTWVGGRRRWRRARRRLISIGAGGGAARGFCPILRRPEQSRHSSCPSLAVGRRRWRRPGGG